MLERKLIFSFLKDRLFYGWVVIAAGLLIALIGLGTRYSFGVFLKSIEGEFGVSRGETSGIFSAYMLFCGLLSILGGWALDRYGPRKVAFVMASFTGFSLLLTSQANAAWQLFITYGLLLSLGTGPVYTVVNSTASRWFKRKRGFAVGITSSGGGLGAIMGMMSAGWALGAAIGPAVGGYIFDASGSYFTAFATGAAAVLISALLVALIKRRTSNEERGAEDLNSH